MKDDRVLGLALLADDLVDDPHGRPLVLHLVRGGEPQVLGSGGSQWIVESLRLLEGVTEIPEQAIATRSENALDGRRLERTALVAEPAALTIWTLGLIPICLFVRLSMSCGGGSCEGAPKEGVGGASCKWSDAHMSCNNEAATSAGASFL